MSADQLTDAQVGPPPELLFKPRIQLRRALGELWHARELVRALVEREFRARYKQAVLGVAWAFITPVAYMVVFSVFVQRAIASDIGDVPYPIFAYVGLLPWTFFSTAANQGSNSLLVNTSLLNKVYCPREVFPLASVAGSAIDSLIATIPLVALFVAYTFVPSIGILYAPLFLLLLFVFTIGVALILSSVTVFLRDVRHLVPIVLQLGLFATPVAYGIEIIPEDLRLLYCFANPVAPVIDGLRRTMLAGQAPQWDLFAAGCASAVIVLVVGYRLFKRLERGLADVA